MSPLIASLLSKRGVTDVEAFLNPDYTRDVHDPFLMPDMNRAVARIFAAMQTGERIAVYADFDCDGVPGASLLLDLFARVGHAQVQAYIPHRDLEGYGVHTAALDTLAAQGVSLVITVDVGTTAVEAIAHAKKLGMDVIVTDHHEMSGLEAGALPECIAVLNPKRGYPFPDLCGAGVAYKLAQALCIEGRRRGIAAWTDMPEGWEKWLLDLVAIATVADMVPLVGENRALVRFGLTVLRKSPRPGLKALCTQARIRQAELTEDDIGFTIAPRLNAASRMGEPELALRLLTTKDAAEAAQLAAHLEGLNTKRKTLVATTVREARKRVAARYAQHDAVVCLGDKTWKPAILGLVANSIMQERGGLVCLWGEDGAGALKGSCRSDGNISVAEVLAACGDTLEAAGGHAASGGFTVSRASIHTFPETLAAAAQRIGTTKTSPATEHKADAILGLHEVGARLYEHLSHLSPFGVGNPKPVFRFARTQVGEVRRFGKEKAHTEVIITSETNGARVRTFQFFQGPDDFTTPPAPGLVCDIMATVERDTYRGGLALRLVDIVLSQ